MTGASIVHQTAGLPSMVEAAALPLGSTCWMCAEPATRGVQRIRWEGANFVDQNKCRDPDSAYVCEACAWCCSWVPPPGWVATRTDTKRTPMLRSYTHLWSDGMYRFTSKAEKPLIRAWLRGRKSSPWFAAIADSGQKHLLPWVPINYSRDGERGLVLFEESVVSLPSAAGWSLVDRMTEILTQGVTKAEIETGDYSVRSWRNLPVESLRDFERLAGAQRGARWFALALWLAQRNEEEHAAIEAARKAKADGRETSTRPRGRRAPGSPQPLSPAGGGDDQALDAAARARAGRSPQQRDDRRVDQPTRTKSGDGRSRQGDLFGDRRPG